MRTEIRTVTAQDGTRVWQLLGQLAVTYRPDEAAFAATFNALLGRKDTVFLVATADSAAVGYLLGYKLPTLFANGPILEIVELVVDEPRRGEGFGKKLVEGAVTRAWSDGCIEAVVMTRRAVPFYENLGFVRSADYLKLKSPC